MTKKVIKKKKIKEIKKVETSLSLPSDEKVIQIEVVAGAVAGLYILTNKGRVFQFIAGVNKWGQVNIPTFAAFGLGQAV